MRSPSIDAEHIRVLFEQANIEVLKSQSPVEKMKSTAVALFIKDDAAIWAHVGDSRLYHFFDGRLVAQTLDHSVSQMAVFLGEIKSGQIRHHADRNRLLKAFGAGGELKAEIAPACTLEPGFHAFLLCTDGFWEYVWELEMEIDLAGCSMPHEWIKAMIQRLSRRVPQDNDNFDHSLFS
jgi:serine/threonine protein phosphatase PrpC